MDREPGHMHVTPCSVRATPFFAQRTIVFTEFHLFDCTFMSPVLLHCKKSDTLGRFGPEILESQVMFNVCSCLTGEQERVQADHLT